MPFASKTSDWRRLPTEARESFLAALRQRATAFTAVHLDPVQLAERCGVVPDDWQRDLLLSKQKQIIMNCSRQSGKSTVAALLGLHQCLFVPRSLVLLLSPSQRQSQELFRKVQDYYGALSDVCDAVQTSALRIEFANGSRVVVLPAREHTIRGFSAVNLLVIDEASRVPDELYQSSRPMTAVSGGRIVLLSTPFGSRGFYFQEWVEGGPDWKRVRVTADQCPRIPPEWLEKERQRIGDWWYSQEYQCNFVDSLTSCFSSADIQAAITTEVQPLWGL
jgi:hypothetical protein